MMFVCMLFEFEIVRLIFFELLIYKCLLGCVIVVCGFL